ncbi:MAG: hypothetical protein IJS96_10460 [Schwartzia sp.]|nr:hypothetical protein [Schwartzia sp. (in: firmicutes)]
MGALGLLLAKLLMGLADLVGAVFGVLGDFLGDVLDEDLIEDWPVFLVVALIFWAQLRDSPRKRRQLPVPPEYPEEPAETAPEESRPVPGLGFEIPPLAGAPRPEEPAGDGVYREEMAADSAAIEAEQEQQLKNHYQRYLEEKTRQEQAARATEEAIYRSQAKLAAKPAARFSLPPLSPSALQNAILYAEILGPPRSRRRKK